MGMAIEKFEVKNEARGENARRLATFSVNFGAMSVNGFELIEAGSKRFISAPHRRYKAGNGEYKRYSYIWFNDAKGEQIQAEIAKLAVDEYTRRNGAPASKSVGSPPEDLDDYDPFE